MQVRIVTKEDELTSLLQPRPASPPPSSALCSKQAKKILVCVCACLIVLISICSSIFVDILLIGMNNRAQNNLTNKKVIAEIISVTHISPFDPYPWEVQVRFPSREDPSEFETCSFRTSTSSYQPKQFIHVYRNARGGSHLRCAEQIQDDGSGAQTGVILFNIFVPLPLFWFCYWVFLLAGEYYDQN
jgi:hypothetical protein